jgi:hypothetical protein
MAAGKDFNDDLTFILNHAEVSLDLLGPEHPACESIVELTHAAMRCAETTRCLMLMTSKLAWRTPPACRAGTRAGIGERSSPFRGRRPVPPAGLKPRAG